jgi:hypothetical protein
LDLATDSRAQISKNIVREININKKAEKRYTLMAIIFSDEDILALYEALITRWSNERAEHKKLQVENDELRKKLDDLRVSRIYVNF